MDEKKDFDHGAVNWRNIAEKEEEISHYLKHDIILLAFGIFYITQQYLEVYNMNHRIEKYQLEKRDQYYWCHNKAFFYPDDVDYYDFVVLHPLISNYSFNAWLFLSTSK